MSTAALMGAIPDAEAVEKALMEFAQFDANGSGFIEEKELEGLERLVPSIKVVDMNKRDGKLDRTEWVHARLGCTIEAAHFAVQRSRDMLALAHRLEAEVASAMAKFGQLDKDGSGFIDAKEMDGLKKLFSMADLDIGVKDGKIDRAELFAGLFECSIEAASVAVDRWKLGQQLDATIVSDLKSFSQFDKNSNGFIEATELDGLKKLFTVDEIDVGVKDGKISRAEFIAALRNCYPKDAQAAIDRLNAA